MQRNREFLATRLQDNRVWRDPTSQIYPPDQLFFDRPADTTVWLQRLKDVLVPLGVQVYQPGGVAFPLEDILHELEDILYHLRVSNIPIPTGWVADCLGAMGVDRDILIRTYDVKIRHAGNNSSQQEFKVQLLASQVYILWAWGKSASDFANAADKRRLLASMRAEGVRLLENISNELDSVRNRVASPILSRLESETRSKLNDFRRMCDEISLRR